MITLFHNGKLNKIYFIIDEYTGKCHISEIEIIRYYSNKTPSEYRYNLNNLKLCYTPEVFKELINGFLEGTDKTIRDTYQKQVWTKITDYIQTNYNQDTESHLGIKWLDESGTNPLGPCPVEASIWYGKYFMQAI